MANYKDVCEHNEKVNKNRLPIKWAIEYFEPISKHFPSDDEEIGFMARKGISLMQLEDKYLSGSYMDSGWQYSDTMMKYLEANDLVQECREQINGTSIEEQIEAEIRVAIASERIACEFESIEEFFNDKSIVDQISEQFLLQAIKNRFTDDNWNPTDPYNFSYVRTAWTYRDYLNECWDGYAESMNGYDPSDYD